jgi:hypothetical protein
MTTALEGGEWSAARPGYTLPPGKNPVPIVQEAGWAPGLVIYPIILAENTIIEVHKFSRNAGTKSKF